MSSSPPIADVRNPLAPRLIVSFIAALSMLLGPLAFAPANAAEGVTVTGSIAAAGSESLENVPVVLKVLESGGGDEDNWRYVDTDYTDELGGYEFSQVEAGTYRVTADGPSDPVDHTQKYAAKDSAPFAVAAAAIEVPLLSLVLGGSISGTTSVDGEVTTLEDVRVIAYRFVDGRFQLERESNSDSLGNYKVPGLRDGSYRLGFSADDYIEEFYDDLPSIDSEGFVDITISGGNHVVGKNAELTLAAWLTGRVTDEFGDPLREITVSAYEEVTEEGSTYWGQNDRYDSTDEDGNYRVKVPAGVYRLGFDDYAGDYVPEFFDNVRTVDSDAAEEFELSVGESATADAELAVAGRIAGTVTVPGGDSLDTGCAFVFREVDGTYVDESIDPGFMDNGNYVVDGLLPGNYKVRLEDCSGSRTYEPEYYDNVSAIADATVIPVFAGDLTGNIDGQLAERTDDEPPVIDPPVIIPPTQPAPPVVGPPAPVVKKAASISISAKGAKKKATLTITVKAPGVTPTGKITIKLGSKTLKNVQLKNGKAKVTLTKQKKGKRTYKVIYAGDSRVKAKTATSKKVAIK